MTDLTKFDPARPASSRGPANLVSKAMAVLEPVLSAEAVVKETVARWHASLENRAEREFLTNLDNSTLRKAQRVLIDAAVGPTDSKRSIALFGLMLDAIPTAANFESTNYLAALLDTLAAEPEIIFDCDCDPESSIAPRLIGFSTPVIAAAVRRIWREQKFSPFICDVLAAARAERERFVGCGKLAERILRARERMAAHGSARSTPAEHAASQPMSYQSSLTVLPAYRCRPAIDE